MEVNVKLLVKDFIDNLEVNTKSFDPLQVAQGVAEYFHEEGILEDLKKEIAQYEYDLKRFG